MMLRAATRGVVNGRSRLVRGFQSSAAMRKEIEMFIDGKPVMIEEGSAIIQAAEKAGVTIPRFCYHERLGVAGNCRMCLVEIEKNPKMAASCAMPVGPGMRVITESPKIKQAREGVMEFLLANHPLDCPICDQGGECDLQDQSMRYGSDRGRFNESKRAVEDKDIGPLVRTTMTRCIQCTRCVRFINEVAGTGELGTTGRGNDMQIGTYVTRPLASELSGNIIDLCPVGALTAKPHAFTARPWELTSTDSIDVMDALGSAIRVDSRGAEVVRIVPRTNDDVNEEWIGDKARFAYDGLKRQRLTVPLVRSGAGRLEPASWADALQIVGQRLRSTAPEHVAGVAGALADAEALVALKDLLNAAGCERLGVDSASGSASDSASGSVSADVRSSYTFNATLAGVEDADVILLVGTNPRREAPVLNARLRKPFLAGSAVFGVVGDACDLTFDYEHVGTSARDVDALANGSHAFAQALRGARRPLVVVGAGAATQPGVAAAVARLAASLPALVTHEWNGLCTLQAAAGRTAALDVGYTSYDLDSARFVYLLGADGAAARLPPGAFVVYQGHHGDAGAHAADVVLPAAAYTEKAATFVNTEGRTQRTRQAVAAPGAARDDWKIIRALSDAAGLPLPYDDVSGLRARMADVCPSLVAADVLEPTSPEVALLALSRLAKSSAPASDAVLASDIADYYMTDAISRASRTMAKASAAANGRLASGSDGAKAEAMRM